MNKIDFENLKELTPSQDFIDDIAFTCIMVKKVTGNGKVSENIELITSEKKHFPLTNNELFNLGFYSERTPFPKCRWSRESIQSFLNGNSSTEIKEVFEDIKKQFEEYIDFSDSRYYILLSIWIIGTYFHRLFNTYPYIHLNGRISSGKTKTLTLISLLAFNGELSFQSTPSAHIATSAKQESKEPSLSARNISSAVKSS